MARRRAASVDAAESYGVDALLDFYITEHEAAWGQKDTPSDNGEARPKPGWRCSSLGKCPRAQILERAGTPKTQEPDEMARRRFQAGDDMHWFLRKRLARMGLMLGEEIPVSDTELALTGHIDAIFGGDPQEIPERWRMYRKPDWVFFLEHLREATRVRWGTIPVTALEIKSMNSWSMRQIPLHGRFDQMMQLAGYHILGVRHPDALPAVPARWETVLLGRDSVAVRRIPLTKSWVELTAERIGLLNEAWTSGAWPNCDCGTVEGMEWAAKYCSFLDRDDPSTCCGQSLLDKLEASL